MSAFYWRILRERLVPALVAQDAQQILERFRGFRMDEVMIDRPRVIVLEGAVAAGRASIDLARGHAVAEHFQYIVPRIFMPYMPEPSTAQSSRYSG